MGSVPLGQIGPYWDRTQDAKQVPRYPYDLAHLTTITATITDWTLTIITNTSDNPTT